MNLDPLEVRDRLRIIERRRCELLDEAQTARNQCTHARAIVLDASGFHECMACAKRWEDLPPELVSSVVNSWQDTLRGS